MSFPSSQVHLQNYFDNFPEFEYDATQETIEQFELLSTQQSWTTHEVKKERKELQSALVLQFNDTYGEDEADIEGWQKLCRAIKLERVPGNVTACRKLFQSIHVNLVDLVDAQGTGHPVNTFPTEAALAKYTKNTSKFFPREDAKAGGLLKLLLRKIMSPGARDSRVRKSKRR